MIQDLLQPEIPPLKSVLVWSSLPWSVAELWWRWASFCSVWRAGRRSGVKGTDGRGAAALTAGIILLSLFLSEGNNPPWAEVEATNRGILSMLRRSSEAWRFIKGEITCLCFWLQLLDAPLTVWFFLPVPCSPPPPPWLQPGWSTSPWACWCSRPPRWCSPCGTPVPCRPKARGTWPPRPWWWPRSWRSSPACCSFSRSTVSDASRGDPRMLGGPTQTLGHHIDLILTRRLHYTLFGHQSVLLLY